MSNPDSSSDSLAMEMATESTTGAGATATGCGDPDAATVARSSVNQPGRTCVGTAVQLPS
jgi:hypothetical protein